MLLSLAIATAGCGGGSSRYKNTIVVNSLEDPTQPASGVVTLRAALEQAQARDRITFDAALNGGTVRLSIIGAEHSVLQGEVYSGMTFQGYAERDYGKSALYARKDVTIDASDLPTGITIEWTGGDGNRARVLAVYGNLTLKNVNVIGGYSSAEPISSAQAYTLARGGGLAVWGTATLENCAIAGNRASGDLTASRDRGTYGGGIYANGLRMTNSVVSGNSVIGYGAAGGGIYSVGGGDNTTGIGNQTTITGSTISGNRVTAQHAYGGGIFTLSGGPNNLAWMHVTNSTIARNLVEDNPDLPDTTQRYYRGGGIYMGGGSLDVVSSTIVENEVNGSEAIFNGSPNIGGGGVAATIGNAHVVEDVTVRHSIVAGNKVNGANQDWYAGSLLNFYSFGYNRFGKLDFSRILVPVPDWQNLSRKRYPKVGDRGGVALSQVLDLNAIQQHGSIISAGSDAGQPAVLWYPPTADAVDQVVTNAYTVSTVNAGYSGWGKSTDDFLNQALQKIKTNYSNELGSDFGSSFGNLTGTTWYGPRVTWPTDPKNQDWITFWRNLDTAIGDRLGPAPLNDEFWATFSSGRLGSVTMTVSRAETSVRLINVDQRGKARTSGLGDIGAIEK